MTKLPVGYAGRIGITKVNSLVISTNNYTESVVLLNQQAKLYLSIV